MEEISQNQMLILFSFGIAIMLLLSLSLILFFNFSQKKILAEKTISQEKEIEHQKVLLHSVLTTQEEERRRIAKDLHDDIGSKLNVIRLNMHQLKKQAGDQEDLLNNISDVNGLLSRTIQTTRRISHDLLPPTLDNFGLIEALKEFKEGINKGKPEFLELKVYQESDQKLEKSIALHLFRIIQEFVSNTIKYAEAENVHLDLQLMSDEILVIYKDDGKGMDLDEMLREKGLGFKNIDSRLSFLNGNIKYESSLGSGFQATITIPA